MTPSEKLQGELLKKDLLKFIKNLEEEQRNELKLLKEQIGDFKFLRN